MQLMGSTDETKIGAALSNESSKRGKGRVERVRKDGKTCWWRITDAGRASVRSEGTSIKESHTNGHTHSAAALR